MEHKTCKAVVLNTDEAQGVVECIFSVFGVLDFGNDIVHNGAFTKTWSERAQKINLLDSHNTNSVLSALGKPLEFRELRRGELPQAIMDEYPEATGGAWAKVQFNMKTDAGRDAFWHVHDGDIDQWSYGYDATDKDHTKINWRGQEVVARNLRTIKQYELSPCIFGMNEATTTTDAKSADDKAVSTEPEAQQEGEGKAVDFLTVLTYERVEEGLWEERWKIDSALSQVINKTLKDEEMDDAAKRELITVSLDQYSQAVLKWLERALTAGMMMEEMYKSIKAGRVLSARNAKRIKAAMDELHTCLMEAGLMEMPEEEMSTTGPQKAAIPSTSDATGSQPEPDGAGTDTDSSTRLLKLIELELEETEV